MTDRTKKDETARMRSIRKLHEFIAALDRRVPQIERAGEIAIAQAAEALRIDAVRRIEELEREATQELLSVDAR